MADLEARKYAGVLADALRRIEALERGTSLSHSSIEGGYISAYDDDGNLRQIIGNLPDGTTGVVDIGGPVPAKPTPPLVTTRMGAAIVAWRTSDRVNYATNPSFENGVAPFIGNGGAVIALVGAMAAKGTYSLGVRWTVGSTVTADLSGFGLTPGEFYTVAVTVNRGGLGPHVEMRVTGDEDVASTVNGPRLAVTFRMPDTPPTVTLTAIDPASDAQSWLDLFSVVPGTDASVYFDGDDPGYNWLGTPHASPSVAIETPSTSDISHAQVHVDTFPGFTPTPATFRGAILPGGGVLTVPLPVGIPYYVKLVLVTLSGRSSPPSDPTPVRVRPIETVDLGPGSVTGDAIGSGAIQESHLGFTIDAGGVTMTYGPEPHSTPEVNDLWWDSDNGYQPNRWDGDSWEPFSFGEPALAADSVTAKQVAAGAVTAGALAAGSVSTEKLTVGAVAAGNSRLLNYDFETPATPGPGSTRWSTTVEAGSGVVVYPAVTPIRGARSASFTLPAGARVRHVNTELVPVLPGETWAVKAQVRADRALTTPGVVILAFTSDTPARIEDVTAVGTRWQTVATATPTTTPVEVAGQFVIPAGAKYLTIALRAGPDTTPWTVVFDDVVLQPVISGVQIANGAVQAQHVAAEAIRGEHIEGQSITGDLLAGQVVLGSTLITPETDAAGNPIPFSTISPAGYESQNAARQLKIRLSNTDAPTYLDSDILARAFTASEGATLEGSSTVNQSSTLTLAGAISPPGNPPTLTPEYDRSQIDTVTRRPENWVDLDAFTIRPIPNPDDPVMIRFDPLQVTYMTTRADGRFAVCQLVWETSTRVWVFNTDGTYHSHTDWYGWRLTGYVHDGQQEMAVARNYARDQWYAINLTTKQIVEIDPGTQQPTIGWKPGDPAGQFFLVQRLESTGTWTARKCSVVGGALDFHAPRVDLAITTQRQTAGFSVGTFDYADGVQRFATTWRGTNLACRVFDAATGTETSGGLDAWPSAVPTHRAFCWNGTAFYDLDDNGVLHRYSTNKWTTAPGVWWFASTLYDSNTGGTITPPSNDGRHETRLGTKRALVMPKRANLRVGLPALPPNVAGSTDHPDRWRLYGCRTTSSTTVPTDTAFFRQGEGAARTVLLGSIVTSGPPPPTVTNFPAALPAVFQTSAVWADGTPKVRVVGDGVQNILPPGSVFAWAGTAASRPAGTDLCDGRTVPITGDYAAVYAAIGTRFGTGAGDGVTMSLPDLPAVAAGVVWLIKL